MHTPRSAVESLPRENEVRPLTGNEAIARGAWEAGVRVAAAYPGTPQHRNPGNPRRPIRPKTCTRSGRPTKRSRSTSRSAPRLPDSRALCADEACRPQRRRRCLHVADLYRRERRPGASPVCDDPGIHSSQNEQDTRIYGQLATVPVLEPSDAQEALDLTRLAFEMSEQFDTPVIVRGTTRLSHTRSAVAVGERTSAAAARLPREPAEERHDPGACPAAPPGGARARGEAEGIPRRPRRSTAGRRATPASASSPPAPAIPTCAKCCPNASVLKLGASWPLPEELLRRYLRQSVDRVFVVEELEPVIEKEIARARLQGRGQGSSSRAPASSRPNWCAPASSKAGILEPRRCDNRLDAGTAGASAGAVRRLPAHLELHGGARLRRARRRRHRLLHAGLPRSAARPGHHACRWAPRSATPSAWPRPARPSRSSPPSATRPSCTPASRR